MANDDDDGSEYNGPNGEPQEETTPNERPEATLSFHRPYVLALVAVIAPLHDIANRLATICHEFRVAREPVPRSTLARIAETGDILERLGVNIKTDFSK